MLVADFVAFHLSEAAIVVLQGQWKAWGDA